MTSIRPGLTQASRAAAATVAAAPPRLPTAALGPVRAPWNGPGAVVRAPVRRLSTPTILPPTQLVRALRAEVRSALQAIVPPGGGRLDTAQWKAACELLNHAEANFAHALKDTASERSPADALALHELRGLMRAVNDCWPAFEHLALQGQPVTPGHLLGELGLSHHDLVQIPRLPHANADAVAMLNLAGVSLPVHHEARGSHWASRLFVLINAQSRLSEPALDRAMAGMRAAHDHGIDLLPSLPAGSEVRRGLSMDDGALRLAASRFEGAARSGEVMPLRGVFTGSQAGPGASGAYPGNVQVRVAAAEGSALKDSSAFNYVPEQREAKARALSVVVRDTQLLPAGQPLPHAFAIDAHASASSGRNQKDFADGPVLLVHLQEVPPRR